MSPIFGTTWSLPVSQQDLPDWQQRLSGQPVCCSGGRNKRSFARGHFACRAELTQWTGSSFPSLDMAAEELLAPSRVISPVTLREVAGPSVYRTGGFYDFASLRAE